MQEDGWSANAKQFGYFLLCLPLGRLHQIEVAMKKARSDVTASKIATGRYGAAGRRLRSATTVT